MSDESAIQGRMRQADASPSQIAALIHLLGDEDPKITSTAWGHLEKMGEPALPMIEEAVESSADPRVRRQARKFLREWSRLQVFREWVRFCAGDVELERGAFLIARSEYPEVDLDRERSFLAGCAQVLQRRIRTCRTTEVAVAKLVEHLQAEQGFTGNTADYNDPDNSYVNRVIERRIGIPISLATVYLLVARRLSLPIEGVGMPQHFILKYQTAAGERFLDPFHDGKQLSSKDCSTFLEEHGITFQGRYLRAVSDREILSHMLGNLLRVYHGRSDRRRLNRVAAMLRLLEK